MRIILAVLLASLALVSCSSDNDDAASNGSSNTDTGGELTTGSGDAVTTGEGDPVTTGDGEPGTGGNDDPASARYRLTFESSWSEASHPQDFPARAHFSPLVGAVHNEQVVLWQPGMIATPGIERMAETGGTTLFVEEVNSAIDQGYALASISGGGISISPGTTSVEFELTRDNPLVTAVSMLAPSPDWFVGVHGLSLQDEDGTFVPSLSVDLPLYDAGTDSGLQYVSSDSDTQPREPIVRTNSAPEDSPFVDGLPQVGTFRFERLDNDEN